MLFHFSVPSNYDYFNSITLLAVVVIAVAGDPWFAVIAALGLEIIPGYWTNPKVLTYLANRLRRLCRHVRLPGQPPPDGPQSRSRGSWTGSAVARSHPP